MTFPSATAAPPAPSAQPPGDASSDTEKALRWLSDLRAKNLITEVEYDEKRKAIIDRL
ncbi:MAG TPA: hypothetical protein VIP09_06345 [Dehalococcoidia bacterium]